MLTPQDFRTRSKIDTAAGPRPFPEVVEPWQSADFEEMDPAFYAIISGDSYDGPRRFWLERPRGHSKSSDLALMAAYLLTVSHRRLSGIAAAADEDQAKLLLDAIDVLVRINGAKSLSVQRGRVVNSKTGSELKVISSDVGSSYGIRPDFIIADELAHWSDRGEQLWGSLFSSSAKRASCVLLVITNAGFAESWQWKLRERVRTDPAWHFSRQDGPVASWITADILAEQERLLPRIAFDRLWLNRWASGSGDALRESDIDAAMTLASPLEPSPEWAFVGGLDLGLKRDSSAFVVLGRHVGFYDAKPKESALSWRQRAMIDCGAIPEPPTEYDESLIEPTGRLAIGPVETWNPKQAAVRFEEIEQTIRAAHAKYKLLAVAFDPWQCEHLAERLRGQGVPMVPINFGAQNQAAMAQELTSSFVDKNIDLWPHSDLVQDLRSLRVIERQTGFRLESPRDERGHGDRATALSLAMLAAKTARCHVPYRGPVVYS